MNNPATGELLTTVPFMGGVETQHAIAAASEAFPGMTTPVFAFLHRSCSKVGVVRGLELGGFWSNSCCWIEIVSDISDMNCYTSLESQDSSRS